MQIRFPVNFSTPLDELIQLARAEITSPKGRQELLMAFDYLLLWQDRFREKYGELVSVSHLSNPDDPPDVIAHFEGAELAIELTTGDPSHLPQSDALYNRIGNNRARTQVPFTINPGNAEEAEDMMFIPGYAPWEPVADRNTERARLIIERARAKFELPGVQKFSEAIVLLNSGEFGAQFDATGVFQGIQHVKSELSSHTGWMIGYISRNNDWDYFTALQEDVCRVKIKTVHSAEHSGIVRRLP
jgi:hypothetical protein